MSWTHDSRAPVPHWRLSTPAPDRVLAFSTRCGGVSAPPFDTLNLGRSTEDQPGAVRENRRRLLAVLARSPERLVTAGQVHGAAVARVTEPGHVAAHDALVTATPGLVLAVTTADCMALLYSAGHAVGAAHAGWRGTADGMPAATLTDVCALARVPPSAAAVRLVDGRPRLDLPTAARLALEHEGVAPDRIHDTGACTACEPAWYFSHRRDRGRTGRHWGIAALEDGPVRAENGGGV